MNNFTLEKETGLNIDVIYEQLEFELESGSAEILGASLELNRIYTFNPGAKVVIFTWHGCTLSMSRRLHSHDFHIFTSNSTAGRYLSVHKNLNQSREISKSKFTRGPRVIVVGESDMGKSTLCKVLCNYAVRSDWKPVFVDIDIGQNELSLPGTVGAIMVDEQIDIVRGFTSDPYKISNFGHKSPSGNAEHYKFLIRKMAESVRALQNKDPTSNFSGVIINTCGWVTGLGYGSIMTAARAFEVDTVIVIGNWPLYSKLKKELPHFVNVSMLPRPAEVVPRDKQARVEKRNFVIRNYFHGGEGSTELRIPFHAVKIFRITKNSYNPEVVNIDPRLERHVASLSHLEPTDKDFLHENVLDFVIISKVDMDEQHLTILMRKRNSSQPIRNLLLMDEILINN